ncbi:hypothetical protein N136_01979, partial [Leifsonia aquatica ATCC 14665]
MITTRLREADATTRSGIAIDGLVLPRTAPARAAIASATMAAATDAVTSSDAGAR